MTTSEPHAAQREHAARWLAIGLSQQATADRVGVGLRTVQRWLSEDEGFLARVEELRGLAIERIEPKVWALVELALENMRRMFAGEMKASDPVYVESRTFLNRFFERTFYVEAAPPAGGVAPAAPTFNINVGRDGSEQHSRAVDVIEHDR